MQAIKLTLIGIVIGITNVIPGVSGGTVAVVFGIYDKLIELISLNIKKVFSVEVLASLSCGHSCRHSTVQQINAFIF